MANTEAKKDRLGTIKDAITATIALPASFYSTIAWHEIGHGGALVIGSIPSLPYTLTHELPRYDVIYRGADRASTIFKFADEAQRFYYENSLKWQFTSSIGGHLTTALMGSCFVALGLPRIFDKQASDLTRRIGFLSSMVGSTMLLKVIEAGINEPRSFSSDFTSAISLLKYWQEIPWEQARLFPTVFVAMTLLAAFGLTSTTWREYFGKRKM